MSKNFSLIRNGCYTRSDIRGINDHNERRKESYRNSDIDPSRSCLNVHFKTPDAGYTEMLDKIVATGLASLRGLKGDAILFDEFLLDVNSAYFNERGGYDFAKEFFDVAFQFCCDEVGGGNILSAVMHADERNRALSEELGHDVWHYHMHVVYLPVVKKEIKYTKRCKDPALVGTVKETVNQISHSKRWKSAPVLDQKGEPVRDENGKLILEPSYGELQTRFAEYMQTHGYTDVERGVAGKKANHKSIVDYKLEQDQRRAKAAADRADRLENHNAKLAADIVAKQNALTDLQNMMEYADEVENCRSILQQIFDAISTFLVRTSLLRDKKGETDFFEMLRKKLVEFFTRLRNLLGFELVANIPPEQCQSPQLAEEGEKLALSMQIAAAEQRANSPTETTQNGKEYER